MEEVGGVMLGRYEVIRPLASGGMADLLLARARGLEGFERHVVIKRIRTNAENDEAFIEMFLVEARLAAALHHHNIVQVHDIGEEQGKPYFAMEYVHGEDLRRLLNVVGSKDEQVPLPMVAAIVTAVAAALHHAHEQKGSDHKALNIVHRDVSPANILVGYDGNVKVVDFGIARAAMRRTETVAGMLKGKAPYMAPEQCTGAPVDRRSDVFALGIVLYELVTARRLFKGENEFATMSMIVSGTIPKPSTIRKDLPPDLERIILRALARDPAARYQTAAEMFGALEQLVINAEWRTAASNVAAYMTKLFGTRIEPWLPGEQRALSTPIDFDGNRPGIVPAPVDPARAIPNAVTGTKSAPIARAQQDAQAAVPTVMEAMSSAPVKIPEGPVKPKTGATKVAVRVPVVATPRRGRPMTVQVPVVASKEGTTKPAAPTLAAAQVASARETAPKLDVSGLEAAKLEAAKVEAAKVEAAKIEALKLEAAKHEASKHEASKVEASKHEAPETHASETDAAKVEASKVEASKVEASKSEASKVEASKVDASRAEASKVEASKLEASKAEALSSGAAKVEAATLDAQTSEASRGTSSTVVPAKLGTPTTEALSTGAPATADAANEHTVELTNPLVIEDGTHTDVVPAPPAPPPATPARASRTLPPPRTGKALGRPTPASGAPAHDAATTVTPLPTASASAMNIASEAVTADGEEATEISAVLEPPAPLIAAGTPVSEPLEPPSSRRSDPTELVAPLPSPLRTDAPRSRRSSAAPLAGELPSNVQVDEDELFPPRRPAWFLPAIGGVIVVLAIILFAVARSGGSDEHETKPEPPAVTETPKPTPAAAVTEEVRDESTPRTWANSQPAAATDPVPAGAPAVTTAPAGTADPAPPPEVAPTHVATKPVATKPVATKPAATRPVASRPVATKPAVKPTTIAKTRHVTTPTTAKPLPKPKWNPNKLFPNKK